MILLSSIGNNFMSENVPNQCYTFFSAVKRSISIACVINGLSGIVCSVCGSLAKRQQISAKLSTKRSHDMSHFILSFVFRLWEGSISSCVRRPNAIISSLARWDQKSEDVDHLIRVNDKFMNLYLPVVQMHPRHSWFWSVSNWCEEHSTTNAGYLHCSPIKALSSVAT